MLRGGGAGPLPPPPLRHGRGVSSPITPLIRALLDEVENLLEGAGVQEEGLASRVVQEVTSRFGEEWTAAGKVASDPDLEVTCLPAPYRRQVRLVTSELVPQAQLEEEEEEAYGCDDDDNGVASPFLPFPPPPPPLLASPSIPHSLPSPPPFPPALPSMVGGGQGSQ